MLQRFGCILVLAAAIMTPPVVGGRSMAQQRWPSMQSFPETGIQVRLTGEDRRLDCIGLRIEIDGNVEQARSLQKEARKEEAGPPVTVEQMFGREAGNPEAGVEAVHQLSLMRRRLKALSDRYAEKACGHLDPKSLLTPAAIPASLLVDRCQTRNELKLEDCVEDIAQWRCRSFARQGHPYLDCLQAVAKHAIGASGFDRRSLSHYGPACTDSHYAAPSCTIFTNDTTGGGTQWCQRHDESTIEVCEQSLPPSRPSPKPKASPTLAFDGFKPSPEATPAPAQPGGSHTNCQKRSCPFVTCHRLCAPPRSENPQPVPGPQLFAPRLFDASPDDAQSNLDRQ